MFGLTDRKAQTLEIEDRDGQKITRVLSRGLTRRAAVRAARLEANELIPFIQQDVLTVTRDRDLRFQTRYLVTITHNQPGVDRGY